MRGALWVSQSMQGRCQERGEYATRWAWTFRPDHRRGEGDAGAGAQQMITLVHVAAGRAHVLARGHRRSDGHRLRQLGHWLEQQVPGVRWRACVDSAPLLDKAWAEEAGLGWITKFTEDNGFINRDNLLKQKEEGEYKKWVI